MEILVSDSGSLESALKRLQKEFAKSGLPRELRLKAIPKKSVRRGIKASMARARKMRLEARRQAVQPNDKDRTYLAEMGRINRRPAQEEK
jgi:ribosomal protein S21